MLQMQLDVNNDQENTIDWRHHMQKKYFNFMQQVKHTILYLDLYADRANLIDTCIQIIIAFASSVSIAAWAIWKEWPFLWSFIIVLSQILTVVNKYLPYKTALKMIAASHTDLKLLYIDLESDWFYVASGALTGKKINRLLRTFKRQYTKIEGNVYNDLPVRINKRLNQKAESQTESYFKYFVANDTP